MASRSPWGLVRGFKAVPLWSAQPSRACISSSAWLRNAQGPSATLSQESAAAPQQNNSSQIPQAPAKEGKPEINPRLPRSVQAVYLKPLRRHAEYGLPSCDLQLRSYSVRNLEFFCDFALRAAYYLKLPASGPVPLPRITERWTVPRSNFVHKKSQENYERKTLRRLIQIQDGHPETVELWLAFLRQHAYYGVGMKANVWEHEKLGSARSQSELPDPVPESKWAHFGRKKSRETSEKVLEIMNREGYKKAAEGNSAFSWINV
ncbi:ribosomal protein S10 [Xylona heveae TC161]|uniref:Small ribosomal subunit protein uS10m n=1 Tax=Xylona heveae (strain CBS 132557 / TC161) TaxID=1328760 RepID=A0A165FNZ8_XYLHT|nr:ribosomal protein S10 [Xylona heveae TC161]KZF21208.1 ribosomal protein S10 [Xylona heveae TC161]